jgi:profilin
MQILVAGLKGDTDKLWADGTHIAGEKYVTTKAEERSIYARKVCILFLYSKLRTSPMQ